jgi:hypothetical protein
VQISFATWLKTRYAQAKRYNFATVEPAEYLATDFARHNEQAHRQQLNIFEAPNVPLQPDSGCEFVERGKLMDVDVRL